MPVFCNIHVLFLNLVEIVCIRVLECRVAARLDVRNILRRAGHIIKFRPDERFELVGGRMHYWMKKALHILAFWKRNKKN